MTPNETHGYITLSRKMTEWQWIDDGNMLKVFIQLLFAANIKSKKWKGVEVGRGEAIIVTTDFAKEHGLSRQELRTCLARLEADGTICKKSTNKYTIITICNYDTYQLGGETLQPTNNQRTTNEQPTNNQRIYKEKRKKENNIYISTTTTPERVCTCEGDETASYLDECLGDETWQEAICMNYKIKLGDIPKKLEEFRTHLVAQGVDEHESIRDFKSHFTSWLRIKENNKNNEKISIGLHNKRRSYDARNHTPEEYDQDF